MSGEAEEVHVRLPDIGLGVGDGLRSVVHIYGPHGMGYPGQFPDREGTSQDVADTCQGHHLGVLVHDRLQVLGGDPPVLRQRYVLYRGAGDLGHPEPREGVGRMLLPGEDDLVALLQSGHEPVGHEVEAHGVPGCEYDILGVGVDESRDGLAALVVGHVRIMCQRVVSALGVGADVRIVSVGRLYDLPRFECGRGVVQVVEGSVAVHAAVAVHGEILADLFRVDQRPIPPIISFALSERPLSAKESTMGRRLPTVMSLLLCSSVSPLLII